MNYNDFPILNNDEYNLINNHYLNKTIFDRKKLLSQINNEIINCINLSFNIQANFNLKIRKSIENMHKNLVKIQTNLTTTFNLDIVFNQNFSNFNLFSFINRILNIINQLTNLILNEQKEYYKKLINKNIEDLICALKEIFLALDNSNLLFFKHM